jgi:bla regulator protein BlaR1
MIEHPGTLLLPLARATAFLLVTMVAVRLLLRLFRIQSPRAHRLACLAVLAQGWLLLPFTIAIPWYDPLPPVVDRGPWSVEREEAPAALATRGFASDAPRPTPHAPPSTTYDPQSPIQTAGWALLALWIAGMAGTALLLAGNYVRFVRRLPPPRPLDPVWEREWHDLLAGRGIARPIPLRITDHLGPMLCLLPRGYVVLVPGAFWRQSRPEERRAILLHELSHYERGDVWKQWLAYLLALPHWFNPGAWWAVRTFAESAEWSCDRAVADVPARGLPYLRALCRLVEARVPAAIAGPCAHAHPLVHRVRRLTSPDSKRDPLWRRSLFGAAVAGLCLLALVRIDLVAREAPPASPPRPPADPDIKKEAVRPPDPPRPPAGRFFPPRRRPGQPDLLMGALDADGDGALSPEELANAARALEQLDKDGDGRLSPREMRPNRPPSRFGRGRPFPPGRGWRPPPGPRRGGSGRRGGFAGRPPRPAF